MYTYRKLIAGETLVEARTHTMNVKIVARKNEWAIFDAHGKLATFINSYTGKLNYHIYGNAKAARMQTEYMNRAS